MIACYAVFLFAIVLLLINRKEMKRVSDSRENKENFEEIKTSEDSGDRRQRVNEKRKNMPCFFDDGMSFEDFERLAKRAGKKIDRVKSVTVCGAVVYCVVESISGYTDWDFSMDFNNWGHVTGTYWVKTDNDDSLVPKHFGDKLTELIQNFYEEKKIVTHNFSYYIDQNVDLETGKGICTSYKQTWLQKIFSSPRGIRAGFERNELIGEHLYSVVSVLRHIGFKKIKSLPVRDINNHNYGYPFEVEEIVINESNSFKKDTFFLENAEVLITYREKQRIVVPYKERVLKRGTYADVVGRLRELGFSNIREQRKEDIITGWLVKNGFVQSILIDGYEPIQRNIEYEFDREIVVCYHTWKRGRFTC